MVLYNETLCLEWMLEMMSCRNNGLFWLVHIVKLGNGWTTRVHVLLLQKKPAAAPRLGETRLMSGTGEISAAAEDIQPNIKNN